MSKPYTIVQVKRTTKDLDSTEIKSIIPRAGEWVLEYKEGDLTTNNTEELVIGNGHNDIEHLPRLKINALSSMLFAASSQPNGGATKIEVGTASNGSYFPTFTSGKTVDELPKASDRFTLKLDRSVDTLSIGNAGTSPHKGVLELFNGDNNKIILSPPGAGSISSDITYKFPDTDTLLVTLAIVGGNIASATATTPATTNNSTRVATTAFVNNFMDTFKTSDSGLKSGSVSTVGTGVPTSSSPANKSTGSLYVDNSTGILYYYDGSAWKPIVGVWG